MTAAVHATAVRRIPTPIRRTLLFALVGLALTVPFSAPDGTGMQWDELVLACVAFTSFGLLLRRVRRMDRAAARPWWPLMVGALSFGVAQLLAGSFPGPEFDGFGIDDVVLFIGATSPLVSCSILARRVSRTRWPALVVDGLVITVALLVVTEVLRTPVTNPVGAPDDLRSLVLAYGGYAAVMLGGAGAMCTVSTAALRRAATTMIGAVALQATAAASEAMAIVAPSPGWTAASDLAVAVALLGSVTAVLHAPMAFTDRTVRATAPVVTSAGLALVILSILSLPAAIGYAVLDGQPLTVPAEIGLAVVFGLMGLRLVLRIHEDGQMSEDLVRSEESFRELVESSSDGVVIVDDELRLVFTSPAARALLGISGREEDIVLPDLVDATDRILVRAGVTDENVHVVHFRITRADGSVSELELSSTSRPTQGRRMLYLRDVTTRRRRERELERMAYTDHLTGLPNRAMLFEEMSADERRGERCLLVVDLDGFKAVNDVAGHESGDQLLVDVARRLHTVVRDDDLVARLGGDEFAILVTGTLEESVEVAQRVVDVLALPHRTGDWTFALGGSVGVAALGAGGGQLAFREADTALRAAKQAGKGCVRVASEYEDPATDLDVAAAIADGALRVRYDTACTPDGRMALAHAVAVWEHPVHGTVRGVTLWTAAERQGSTAALQSWLLDEACTQAVAFDESVRVVVSLPNGYVDADGLAGLTLTASERAGLSPSRLVISLTEETLLTSSAALVPELEAARRTGVQLCLDNYGMGHSLFGLLARISLDYVRVDLSVLAARDDTDRALQVLSAIVRTNSGFDLTTIAGGISTPELFEAAVAAGAPLINGRTVPHGLTAAEVAARLADAAV